MGHHSQLRVGDWAPPYEALTLARDPKGVREAAGAPFERLQLKRHPLIWLPVQMGWATLHEVLTYWTLDDLWDARDMMTATNESNAIADKILNPPKVGR